MVEQLTRARLPSVGEDGLHLAHEALITCWPRPHGWVEENREQVRQLWDIATQQPIGGPLPTPGDAIMTLAFSADSDTLYAGSTHVSLQRYPIGTTQAVTRVCARAGGADLTEAQWHTHALDLPHRREGGDSEGACRIRSRPGESSLPWRAKAPGLFEKSRGRSSELTSDQASGPPVP